MLNITGETRIFSKEINKKLYYNTTISNKKEDGTYENMYISVQFKKDVLVRNNTTITIKNGFLSFYKAKDETQKLKLVVLDFDYDCQVEEEPDNDWDEDELPF